MTNQSSSTIRKSIPWMALVGVFFLMCLQLRLQGRLWTCACGYIWIWSGNIKSADNSQHLFDPYTFTHVMHGFLFFGLVQILWPRISREWKFVTLLSAEALWEVLENTSFIVGRYRSATISLGYVGDTILNSFGDIAACAAGGLLAWRLGLARTVVLACIVEVILLLTIRDSLLLNVIMLLYPIDAVRVWQQGY